MIFDSLGADRGKKKVIMTIKEYLDHEWKAKYPETPSHIMASMFDTTVKVPLQKNNHDCGIFLIMYAEEFLKKNQKLKFPLVMLINNLATAKRYEIYIDILILLPSILIPSILTPPNTNKKVGSTNHPTHTIESSTSTSQAPISN